MNEFDKYIKEKIDEENLSVPDSIKRAHRAKCIRIAGKGKQGY